MVRIFDLPRAYVDLADELTLAIMSGETPSEDLVARLEAFKTDGPGAIDAWINNIQEQEAGIEAIKKRKNQLDQKAKALGKTVEYMRSALGNVIDTISEGSYKGEWTAYTTDKATQSHRIVNEAAIPERYKKTPEPEWKVGDINKDLKAGISIPGIEGEVITKHVLTIRS